MHLRALKEEYLFVLKKEIENNIDKYRKGKDFVTPLFQKQIFYEEIESPTNKDLSQVHLDVNKSDFENAKEIYESLDFLTLRQAADEKIWAYLAHIEFPEYISKRWSMHKTSETSLVSNRYFFSKEQSPIPLHALSRLWWAIYLSYDEKRSDPYELSKVLISNSSLFTETLTRKLNNNKVIIRGILLAVKDYTERHGNVQVKQIQSLNIRLNKEAGFRILDILSEEDIKEIALNHLETTM